MKAVIYARTSTNEQSTDNQVPVLKDWAKQRDFEVIGVYQETESAWKPGHQKELARLLSDCRNGRCEFDDISQFSDEKKLCAYADIVPSTHASGGKVFHGRITKTGNKWLRWAAIEAAQTAVRSDSEFRAFYQSIRVRKGTNAAKVATARRLLTIVYRILRQGRFYERRTTNQEKNIIPAALVTS